ncbi:hypothetical protein OFC37_32995, partial [Escherichia coli]|nr:hypothetical protein [Escherichia coli]
AGDFLAADAIGRIAPASRPSERADWIVEPAGGGFSLKLADGRHLSVSGGRLVLDKAPAAFTFRPASGCATYPESGTGASGTPPKG